MHRLAVLLLLLLTPSLDAQAVRDNVRLSPDGTRLAYVLRDGPPRLVIAPMDRPTNAAVEVRLDDDFLRLRWRADSRGVLMEGRSGLSQIHVDETEPRALTHDGRPLWLIAIAPKTPDTILVADGKVLLRLQADGTATPLELPPLPPEHQPAAGESLRYGVNRELQVVLTFVPRADGSFQVLRRDVRGWTFIEEISAADRPGTRPISFDEDNRTLYAFDSRGRDTLAVVSVDVEYNHTYVLDEHDIADATAVTTHPVTGRPEAVQFDPYRPRWRVLEPSLQDDFASLAGLGEGVLNIIDRSDDDALWLVRFESDRQPPTWWVYERAGRTSRLLFAEQRLPPGLVPQPMKAVSLPTAEGVILPGLLTLPADVNAASPVVILLPPAPFRMQWGWQPSHQWLASRGVVVLTLHRRGTRGWGKAFATSSQATLADDITAAQQWLRDQGHAHIMMVAAVPEDWESLALIAQAALSNTPTTQPTTQPATHPTTAVVP